MNKKRCKRVLLSYCATALTLYIGLTFYNQMLLSMVMEVELWFVPVVLYGPYLLLGALIIWPYNKTQGQYLVVLLTSLIMLIFDVFKALLLLGSDAGWMTSWLALTLGGYQILALLLMSVIILCMRLIGNQQHVITH